MYIPKTYTVESVTSGHPDKICDQISDAILDECLRQDPLSRVAIECFGSHGLLVIGGEITSNAQVDYGYIAQQVYKQIGYDDKLEIITQVFQQSQEISSGVDIGGAGDQGIMYGFATNETPELLPLGVVMAHDFALNITKLREGGSAPWLKPDGKVQITIEDNKLKVILVSTQHDSLITSSELKVGLYEKLFVPLITKYESYLPDSEGKKALFIINPAGSWTIGGFQADTGLTGRKLMVDTYGGLIPHGGGCFSGKDATKVDRSAAYMARYVAKQIVSQALAKECLVSVSYSIGMESPLMLRATNEKGEDISHYLNEYDFRPQAIIELLNLRKPIFFQTAKNGHFGNNSFSWEKIL